MVLSVAGCGFGDRDGAAEPQVPPKEQVTMTHGRDPDITVLECGQPFTPAAGGVLTLTGRFPTTVGTGERVVSGTVEATSRVAVRGVVAPDAEVFLVRHGRIATLPVPQDLMGVRWDLAPGKVERVPGKATLVSCDPGSGLVGPGSYDLYTRVVLTPDDGVSTESFGGPWPLEVR
jgi:hypothetical protein